MHLKRFQECLLGRIDSETTANIGRFQGGQQTNIVCDYVEILAEARSLIPEKMEAQVQKMKEAFETAAAEMGGRAEVEVNVMYPGLNLVMEIMLLKLLKKQQKKLVVHVSYNKVVAEVMQMLLQDLEFLQ